MRTTHLMSFVLLAASMTVSTATAADWLTMPSQFSHDPVTGMRVSQFAPAVTPSAPLAADYRTSGFSHTRSTLNYGQSADNYYRVNTWGAPVQPYGEWRFPNRPYSAPYSQWGAPFAGLGQTNLGFFGGNYGFDTGQPGTGQPGVGQPGFGQPGTGQPGVGQPGVGQPGFGQPGVGQPGFGQPGLGQPGAGFGYPGFGPGFGQPLNPYPIGPNSAYPDPPYYDGYHPVYRD